MASADRTESAERPRRPEAAPGRRHLRTILDPVVVEILTRIAYEPATAGEVADALGLEAAIVRARFRGLSGSGQAVRQGKRRRKGRLEWVYSADPRATVLDSAELTGLPARMIAEADLALLRVMVREAVEAIEAGTFQRQADRAQTRIPVSLGDQGLREAVGLHRGLLRDVIDEVESAGRRLARSGEETIEASVNVLFFEFPAERWPLPSPILESLRRDGGAGSLARMVESQDPVRGLLMEVLIVTPATAGELATRLGVPLAKVRYELERLLHGGIVKVFGSRPSRGTMERVFVLEPRAVVLSAEDMDSTRGERMDALCRGHVRKTFRDALEAVRVADTAVTRLIGRIPAAVDEQGFAAITAMVAVVVEKLFDLRERALRDPVAEVPVAPLAISSILTFESAPARVPPAL